MALTKAQVREILSAAGVDAEHMKDAVEKIINGHVATVDALKEEIDTYKADAEKLPGLQKELETARAELAAAKDDGWKDKHDKVKKEFDDYKAGVTAKEAKAAKEAAARAYFEGKGITGKALAVAMRGSGAEIDALELEDGKIKDAKALDALVAGDFAGLVGQTHVEGARTPNPPANNSGGENKPNTRAAQIAAEYHKNLYGETKKE